MIYSMLLIILLMSLFNIYKDMVVFKSVIKINTILWIFCIIFFVIVPFVGYREGFGFQMDYVKYEYDVSIALFIIIIFLSSYLLGYKIRSNLAIVIIDSNRRRMALSLFGTAIFIFGFFYLVVKVNLYGWESLFFRGDTGFILHGKSLVQIERYFIRPLFFFNFILMGVSYSIKMENINKRVFFLPLIYGILAAIMLFPLSVPRFIGICSLLTLLAYLVFIYNKKSFYSKYHSRVITSLIFLGIIFSGVLNVFRNGYSFFILNGFNEFNMWSFFKSGHFDAFENLTSLIGYTHSKGIVFGENLIGALFFFIPRSLWQDKPVGTGTFLYDHNVLNYDYIDTGNTNIGMPIIGEFYLSGGVLFVVIFGFLFARLIKLLESISFSDYMTRKTYAVVVLILSFFSPYILIVMRGDLMTSFSTFVAISMSLYTSLWVNNYSIKLRRRR